MEELGSGKSASRWVPQPLGYWVSLFHPGPEKPTWWKLRLHVSIHNVSVSLNQHFLTNVLMPAQPYSMKWAASVSPQGIGHVSLPQKHLHHTWHELAAMQTNSETESLSASSQLSPLMSGLWRSSKPVCRNFTAIVQAQPLPCVEGFSLSIGHLSLALQMPLQKRKDRLSKDIVSSCIRQ